MGFSARQRLALRRNLDHRQVRTREAHGREISYIEGWYAISEANRIFGFDGWSRETIETKCVLVNRRRNAMRHGLTAATVVPTMEDAEEFERFAAAVRADYRPASTVEHELVARLTSLLWRLRRSTLIETNLFQLQGRLAMEQKLGARAEPDTASPGMGILYRLLRSPDTVARSQADSNTPELTKHNADAQNERESTSGYPNPATIFLRLCNLNSFPIERINRYETALWRQVAQTLFILDACKTRLPCPQPAGASTGQ